MPKSKFKTDRSNTSSSSGKYNVVERLQEIHSLLHSDKTGDQAWQCRTQLLAFLSNTQRETETAISFLSHLQDMACEAEIASKKHIICQFMIGCRNVAFRSKLQSMKDLPSLSELRSLCNEYEIGNNEFISLKMPKSKFKTDRSTTCHSSGNYGVVERLQEIHSLLDNDSDQAWQCRTQLLAFLSRTQIETETATSFLLNLLEMACEAEIASKKHIMCQFIIGCRNVALRSKLQSMKELPSLSELRSLCNEYEMGNNDFIGSGIEMPHQKSAFDMLFERNVVHILERIFLSLDYKTLKNCIQVCKQWNQSLLTDHFSMKVKEVYSDEMWMGKEELNIESRTLNLQNWTSNGREVAYITHKGDNSNTWGYSLILHYIDDKGAYLSTELDCKGYLHVHILKHVILLIGFGPHLIGSNYETKPMLFSMMKENL